MRIAYCTDTYAPEINGVANTLSKLGAYLDGKQIHQLIIAPDYDGDYPDMDSEYRKIYRFNGIISPLAPKSRLAFPAFWETDEIMDSFEPDIIHVTTEFGIGSRGVRYAATRNIPLVTSFHTNFCQYLKYHNIDVFRPFLENYFLWFHSFSARTLVPSRHTLGELSSKGYRNLDIWSRGIDTSHFNPEYKNNELRKTLSSSSDKFIFLYVGRLSAEKSLDLLIQAAAEVERLHPGKATFVFTGDGPYTKIINNSIKSGSLPNIVLTGFKSGKELSEIYASADCFVFPSGTETFGNVVLEAMASRLPVVGVGSGGVTDFLSHNQNSLLCAPEDTQGFSNNLITIMEDENLCKRLGKSAYETALSRNWNTIFDGLVETYADVIKKDSRKTSRRKIKNYSSRKTEPKVRGRSKFTKGIKRVLSGKFAFFAFWGNVLIGCFSSVFKK